MATVFQDSFTGADNTNIVTGHTPEIGTWNYNGAGDDLFKIFSDAGALCNQSTGRDFYVNDLGAGEFDVTFVLHVGGHGAGEGTRIMCRYDPALGTFNGYIFQFTNTGIRLFRIDGTGGDNDYGNHAWLSGNLVDGSDNNVVIKIRDTKKSVELEGVEQFNIVSDTLPTNSTNKRIAVAGTGYADQIPGSGYWLESLQVDTPTSGLVASTPAIIQSSYAGWDVGTGSATSVSHQAVGVHCPTPSSGTPGYTYQWQLSTDAGSTWNNVTGATNQIQLISGLSASTAYKVRCVISDASPTSVNTIALSFTTAATPTAAFVLIGDSTGTACAAAAKNALNASLSVADCVAVGCAKSGSDSSDWTSGNVNNWLKFAVIVARAWGQPVNYCLGINDAESLNHTLVQFSGFADDTIAYTVGQGVNIILHYVTFNNTGGSDGTTFNALIDSFNAYFDGKINGTTIRQGDTQAKNFLAAHTDQMNDALHPNGTGFANLGTLRGRACLRALGTLPGTITPTPSSIDANTSGNVVVLSLANMGLTDGTPGNPTITVSGGVTVTAQVIGALPSDGSPQTGTVTLTAGSAGGNKTISVPHQGTGAILVTGGGGGGSGAAATDDELLLLL